MMPDLPPGQTVECRMLREAKVERIGRSLRVSAEDICITYVPHPDVTSESEVVALAAVYRLILDCYKQKNKAAEGGTHDSAWRN